MTEKEKPPIYGASREEQVDLLAQALLREYMHKRKFHATLKVFDEENPRNDRTVSSRAVMMDLMELGALQSLKSEKGMETIMEMLCYQRICKEQKSEAMKAIREELEKELPPDVETALPIVATTPTPEASEGERPHKKKKHPVESEGDGTKKVKKHKLLSIDELLEQDSRPVVPTKEGAGKAARGSRGAQPDPPNEPTKPANRKPSPKKTQEPKSTPTTDKPLEKGVPPAAGEVQSPQNDYVAALRAIRKEEEGSVAAGGTASPVGGRNLEWDVMDNDAPAQNPTPSTEEKTSNSPRTDPEPQRQLPKDALGTALGDTVFSLLVGTGRRIPESFIFQGFHFSSVKNLYYGLVQSAGGPCGVVSVVQAFILREMMREHGGIPTTPVPEERLASYTANALTTILRMIAKGRDNDTFLIARGGERLDGYQRNIAAQRHLIASMQGVEVHSNSLEGAIGNAVKEWMEPKGQGMLCFVVSCILARGCDAIRSDMDIETPLIVEHGYCSQELTNLMLCGIACSNVHDGVIKQGDLALRGFPRQLDVGFLSHLDYRGLVSVGSFAKEPRSPIWIVFHESHYTVLFQRNSADSSASPLDLFYFDQQGNQSEEIRLTVRLDSMPLPARGVRDLTSYVDDVIRTREAWKLAKISWNGADPLL